MQKPSRLRRFFRFLIFRVIPALLVLAILRVGFFIAQDVARWLSERTAYEQRQTVYAETATAIAPTINAQLTYNQSASGNVGRNLPTPFLVAQAGFSDISLFVSEPTITPVPQRVAQFATNTPQVADDLSFTTNTPEGAVATDVPQSTSTPDLALLQATPRPLPTVLFLGDPQVGQVDVTAIPTRVEPIDRQGYDLMNILLLGSDGEITGDGFRRTDTMIVLSINRTTGTAAMLSLPRDMFAYIPAWGMQRLNLAFARGENGGWNDGAFELIRQTILYNYGINVHYYALVDLTGFKEAIDLLGGVEVAVDCAIQDLPLIGAEVPDDARRINDEGYYVLDVGQYLLDGAEALWYARSRDNSSDFDRGRRQQQVLRAAWRKALDTGWITNNLTNLPELWNHGMEIVETNLRFEDVVGLVPLALNLNPGAIENFALIRTYHTTPWQTPSGDYVQLPVYETLRPLLEDFYQPPTESQILLEGARIRVLNGTGNANWDQVAASRLNWDGLNAFAAGSADRADYSDTILIDFTGQSKGSSRSEIAKILNVRPENVIVNPDANREVDFEVVLGSNYDSCTFAVLPVDG